MTATSADKTWDAIVIGGGPSGASSAAILAEYGHRVLVLEREKFPRYHIGESLIPFTYQPLDRLGLIPKMKASGFVKKYSVVFISPNGKASQPFYFFNRYDRESVAQTWQVLRSEFDQMLLNNARDKGAEVIEEIKVLELLREDSSGAGVSPVSSSAGQETHGRDARATDGGRVVGVRCMTKDGEIVEFRAPITLDCSGKEAFTAVRNGWRTKDPYLNKVAVWTYYKGSKREPGIEIGRASCRERV